MQTVIATLNHNNQAGAVKRCRRLWFLLLTSVCLMSAAPLSAQTEADSTAIAVPEVPAESAEPAPNILDTLDDLTCKELEQVFYRQIPRYVYDDQPDQLYELVLFVDEKCDFGEPLGRIQILASIWDGNFQEVIYGYGVIDWLIDRYESGKSKPGSDREAFDKFTTDFASQLLPHAPTRSLEEFFCLFYTGQTDEAWELLQSEDMQDTWLRYYYDEEIDILTRVEDPHIIGIHWGGWQPAGDLDFVGTKQLVGFTVEQWSNRWFARFILETRAGRTKEPYFVNEAGVSGLSDRWNAILMGVEAGLSVWQSGPHRATAYLGLGYDVVVPFKDEEIAPASVNINLGLGYRHHLGQAQRWYVGIDGRFELIGDRNEGGTNLGGSALSARLGVGMALGSNPGPRLEDLGHKSQ